MTPDITLPEIVVEYVRDKLALDIADLLDDPHGVFGELKPPEILGYMQRLDRLCELVDFKLSDIVSRGTDFEHKRLMDIILEARANTTYPEFRDATTE